MISRAAPSAKLWRVTAAKQNSRASREMQEKCADLKPDGGHSLEAVDTRLFAHHIQHALAQRQFVHRNLPACQVPHCAALPAASAPPSAAARGNSPNDSLSAFASAARFSRSRNNGALRSLLRHYHALGSSAAQSRYRPSVPQPSVMPIRDPEYRCPGLSSSMPGSTTSVRSADAGCASRLFGR